VTTPTDFSANVDCEFSGRKTSCGFGFGDRFKQNVNKDAVMSPPPNSYNIKTSFDGHSPTIRNNTLTTSFKNQSDRKAFTRGFYPGDNKEQMHAKLPAANQYVYVNDSVEAN